MKKTMMTALAALVLAGCGTYRVNPKLEPLNRPVVANYAPAQTSYDGRVQVVAWNLERGIFWKDQAKYLAEKQAAIPATIMLLGETDRMHSRSGDVFVADGLAKQLKMNMVFATEFIEYNDRTKDTPGDHGNCILSPFPLSDLTVLRQQDLFSWSAWGWTMGQSRKGDRVVVGATVLLPDGKKLRVYVVHFENYAASSGRAGQMQQVLDDAKKYDFPAVIGGDYNELPGGLVFKAAKDAGFENTFAGNKQPTGSCMIVKGKLECAVKIDWMVSRGLKIEDKQVDYPTGSAGNSMSDHAPVRAIFR